MLRARRLAAPFTAMSVQRVIAGPAALGVAGELQRLADQGFQAEQMAAMLDLLVQDRCRRPKVEDALDLVITGPDVPGMTNRDTGVVVGSFSPGPAIGAGGRLCGVPGAARFRSPGRSHGGAAGTQRQDVSGRTARAWRHLDGQRSGQAVRRATKTREWPEGRPLPKVFYDPRSLDLEADKRACLHAKCVVVDGEAVFISSANFTEAAQERNIEMGLLVRSPWLAERIRQHFDTLLAARRLEPLPKIGE